VLAAVPAAAAFGLSLFANSSNQARLDLLVKGLPGLLGITHMQQTRFI
jgi:hypothetical protein